MTMSQVRWSLALLFALGSGGCDPSEEHYDSDGSAEESTETDGGGSPGLDGGDGQDAAAGGAAGEELDLGGVAFYRVLAAGENLYLATSFNPAVSERGIYRMPKDGSAAPEQVADVRGVEDMVLIGENVVHKEHTSGWAGWLPGAGGAARSFELDLPVTALGGTVAPNWIVSDGQTSFLPHLTTSCGSSSRTPVYKFAPPEEQAVVLIAMPPCLRAATASDGYLYYATADLTPNYIARIPAAGGAEQVVVENVTVDAFKLAHTGGTLYFSVNSKLHSAPMGGGPASEVDTPNVRGLFQAEGVAILVAGGDFIELTGSGTRVIGSHPEEILYTVRDVAIDDEFLYWLGAAPRQPIQLRKLPR